MIAAPCPAVRYRVMTRTHTLRLLAIAAIPVISVLINGRTIRARSARFKCPGVGREGSTGSGVRGFDRCWFRGSGVRVAARLGLARFKVLFHGSQQPESQGFISNPPNVEPRNQHLSNLRTHRTRRTANPSNLLPRVEPRTRDGLTSNPRVPPWSPDPGGQEQPIVPAPLRRRSSGRSRRAAALVRRRVDSVPAGAMPVAARLGVYFAGEDDRARRHRRRVERDAVPAPGVGGVAGRARGCDGVLRRHRAADRHADRRPRRRRGQWRQPGRDRRPVPPHHRRQRQPDRLRRRARSQGVVAAARTGDCSDEPAGGRTVATAAGI